MQTVPFGKKGFPVSRLGFGMMRLPVFTLDDGEQVIDEAEATRMLRHAIDQGVNYVDTAYGYHFGQSEVVTGKALKGGYREKVLLTSKLPQWLVSEEADMDRLLDEQLTKLDVPYLDFYLLHAMNAQAFEKLKALHYHRFLDRAKKDGRILRTGFSFHDEKEVFLKILSDYPFDLAQIQFNYLDDESQATLSGLKRAGEMGIPVVVMEPLRGGALANPPKEIVQMMQNQSHNWSPVEWAFRYVGDFPEVVTILSGMSSMQQVQDNLRIFENVTPGSLTKDDHAFIKQLKQQYLSRIKVGCTACQYCQPCREGVVIPRIFEIYNDASMLGDHERLQRSYQMLVNKQGDGSHCVSCGQCEAACPQQLPIIHLLSEIDREARA